MRARATHECLYRGNEFILKQCFVFVFCCRDSYFLPYGKGLHSVGNGLAIRQTKAPLEWF